MNGQEQPRAKAGDTSNITVLQDSSTYALWHFEMMRLLKSRGLHIIATGVVPEDEVREDQIALWGEQDADASVLILTTCAPKVKQHLLTCSTACEMLTKLKQVFERDTDHLKCSLMQKFYSYAWDRTMSVMENISHVENLAHQLNGLGQAINETALMTKITHILPPEFNHFTSAWDLSPAADRTLTNLTASLQQEETKIKLNEQEQAVAAFKAEVENKKPGKTKKGKGQIPHKKTHGNGAQPRPKTLCSICKNVKHMHKEKDCFFRSRYCAICKTNSHYQKDCPNRNDIRSPRDRSPNGRPRTYEAYEERRRRDREHTERKTKACFLASTHKPKVNSKIIRIVNRDSSPETS